MTDHTNSTNNRRVALITGASRGLGKTVATFLAHQGFDLVLTARGKDALMALSGELGKSSGSIVAIPGDVRNTMHRRRLIESAKRLGGLNLLFNNASLLGPSPQPLLADYPLEQLEQVYEVNLFAPLGLIQQAVPLLRASHGLVINISSDAAVGGYEGWGGYGSSKAAIDLLSLTLANELRDENVGVVSIDPGDMRTQMHQEAFPSEDISDRPLPDVTIPFWAWLLAQNPTDVSGKRFQAQAEQWLTVAA